MSSAAAAISYDPAVQTAASYASREDHIGHNGHSAPGKVQARLREVVAEDAMGCMEPERQFMPGSG